MFKSRNEEQKLYSHEFTVRASESDCRGEIHADVIFSLLQEASGLHASLNGYDPGRQELRRFAWILNRTSLRLDATPRWLDQVRIYTWQSDQDRLGFTRDYALFGADGTLYGRARSFWTVATLDGHRLLKPESIFGAEGNPWLAGISVMDEKPLRLKPSYANFSRAEVFAKRVGRSDIDRNGHMNNTRYAALCVDAADPLNPGARLKRIDINFVSEVFKGDTCLAEAVRLESASSPLDLIAVRAIAPEGGREHVRAIIGFEK